MPVTDSPLRYPGGKTQLSGFVTDLMRANDLFYGTYVEPFAGGAGIAWKLLLENYMSEIIINDIDPSVYAFWSSVLRHTDDLCELIERTDVTIEEWQRQRLIQNKSKPKVVELGFSTFFLNRTNRSGIIKAGVIGGINQNGNYLLDCRFNKADLIKKIRRIALYKDQVKLHREDAKTFLEKINKVTGKKSLINIDPPYYKRGPELYCSFYQHEDHVELAGVIRKIKTPWMLTYDDSAEIANLYDGLPIYRKELNYSAQTKRIGVELLVLDRRLSPPASLSHGVRTA
ncbi:DNA adenine methylase [Xanthomonas arboricola]|uniref:DNA adenine methylase n=1 Tax=Xanthomonas arboricola TaxID=56448 RepID=UPI0009B9ADB0|nr:DNA adenine methylase [Xanthomonas arboricola]MEA5150737.1 DNA adenine methylase [Xanthomonas arboricola]UQP98806.1 DNA adenine methylase [Xanthomonas arboricola pv. juglandis]UQQ03971.1 DNA adenine methylase [Xanthomonas arboricola pv. juglandis]